MHAMEWCDMCSVKKNQKGHPRKPANHKDEQNKCFVVGELYLFPFEVDAVLLNKRIAGSRLFVGHKHFIHRSALTT